MRFQLWMQDEYGQCNIVSPITENVEEVFQYATEQLNELNVNNALTLAEKQKNWEGFMPAFMSGEWDEAGNPKMSREIVYAGRAPGGVQSVAVLSENGSVDIVPMDNLSLPCQLFLGKLDGKEWFAADEREETIRNIKHRLTEGKTVYFVKVLP